MRGHSGSADRARPLHPPSPGERLLAYPGGGTRQGKDSLSNPRRTLPVQDNAIRTHECISDLPASHEYHPAWSQLAGLPGWPCCLCWHAWEHHQKLDAVLQRPQTQWKELEESTGVLRYVFGTGEVVTDPEKINVLRDWLPHRVSGLRPSWTARDTPPINPQLRRSEGAKRTDTGSPEIRLALNPGHGTRELGLRAVLAGPRKGSSATPPGAVHPWKELQYYGERAPSGDCVGNGTLWAGEELHGAVGPPSVEVA